MSGQQTYQTTQFLRDLEHFNAAWRLLDAGDVAGVSRTLESAPAELRGAAGFQHLLAASLVSAGRFDQAAACADAFVERRPDAFDGIELANRIHAALNRRADREAMVSLAQRRAALVVNALEALIVRHGADWRAVVAAIITSDSVSNGFKARILSYLFDQVLDAEETAVVADALASEIDGMPPAQRVMVAGTLLVYCGRTDAALDLLEALIDGGALTLADYPSVLTAVNRQVGWGDAAALRRRYPFLTRLYDAWTSKLKEGLAEAHRAALAQIRQGPAGCKRVAILAPPLLSARHAPTNRVLEIAVSLQRDFGHTVSIFAGGAFHFRTGGGVPSVAFASLDPILLGAQRVAHDGVELSVWSTALDDSQWLKFPTVALEIARFEPEVVLCYGDASPVQALLAGRIPTVLFPSNSMPPVGPADRYVSLWDEAALAERVARGEWPREIADKAVFSATGVRYPTPTRRMARADLVPEAGLLLVIAGTRIAGEIRGDFARRLADFLIARPEIHLLTIGDADRAGVLGPELAPVADRVHTRGYEADLAELMTGCDIVLNPDRQGGGTGIAMAMAAGCPVVAFDNGDGATLLEAADLSRDIDGYFERLAGLVDDSDHRADVAARMPDRVEAVLGFRTAMTALVEVLGETASRARVPAG